MKTTIDSAGRIVIPRDIRAAAGLDPGTSVEVGVRDGIVFIEPAPASVKIVKRGRLRVAVAETGEALDEESVKVVRDAIRGRS